MAKVGGVHAKKGGHVEGGQGKEVARRGGRKVVCVWIEKVVHAAGKVRWGGVWRAGEGEEGHGEGKRGTKEVGHS